MLFFLSIRNEIVIKKSISIEWRIVGMKQVSISICDIDIIYAN